MINSRFSPLRAFFLTIATVAPLCIAALVYVNPTNSLAWLNGLALATLIVVVFRSADSVADQLAKINISQTSTRTRTAWVLICTIIVGTISRLINPSFDFRLTRQKRERYVSGFLAHYPSFLQLFVRTWFQIATGVLILCVCLMIFRLAIEKNVPKGTKRVAGAGTILICVWAILPLMPNLDSVLVKPIEATVCVTVYGCLISLANLPKRWSHLSKIAWTLASLLAIGWSIAPIGFEISKGYVSAAWTMSLGISSIIAVAHFGKLADQGLE